ncbi:hypothetical protein Tco_1310495 [Tanacetum coccineum]
MATTAAQQIVLNNALVSPEKQVEIGKCNLRINPKNTQKEPTYQVVLDALALTTCYQDFLITASVPIDNRDVKKQEKMYYPRFTKAIIHHLFTKDKSISMRNKMFMHTAQDDSISGTLIFVSKDEDTQTYLAFATRAETPKPKRIYKKPTSPMIKRTTTSPQETPPKKKYEPDKKVVSSKKPATKRQSASKVLKRKKRDTNIHQAGGSSEGAESELEVLDEPKCKSIDTSEGTGSKLGVPNSDDEQTKTDNPKTSDDEEETQDDESVHTPEDYVPTHDETNDESKNVDDEEYESINEELYGDVNISLTDAEPTDKEKDDEEMTVVGHVNVNQEGAGNQVKDDAQATHQTEGLIPSSSISFDYAAKYLTLIIFPQAVIRPNIMFQATRNSTTRRQQLFLLFLTSLFPHLQQLTPIPTPTTTEATTSTTVVSESETLAALHQRISDLEKSSLDDAMHKVIKKNVAGIIKEHSVLGETVERLRQQYAPQKSVEDIQEIKKGHARKKQVPKETITSFDTTTIVEFDQKTTLFKIMTKSKSFKKIDDKLKKRKQDDADKDEGPSAGSDRGLNRWRKDTKPSKKAKPTETSKGTSKSQPRSTSKSKKVEETVFEAGDTQEPQNQRQDISNTDDQSNVKADPKHDWFKKPQRPPTPYSDWNIDNLTQEHLVGPVFNLLKGTCKSHVELEYYNEECYKAEIEVRREDQHLYKFKEGDFPRLHLYDIEDIPLLLVQKKLSNLKRDVIFDLGVGLRMSDISNRIPYTAYNSPQGIIYVDNYKRYRLMRTNELYKVSDGTLTSVRTVLHDIASNLRMNLLPKKRWSSLDRKREELRLLERTI